MEVVEEEGDDKRPPGRQVQPQSDQYESTQVEEEVAAVVAEPTPRRGRLKGGFGSGDAEVEGESRRSEDEGGEGLRVPPPALLGQLRPITAFHARMEMRVGGGGRTRRKARLGLGTAGARHGRTGRRGRKRGKSDARARRLSPRCKASSSTRRRQERTSVQVRSAHHGSVGEVAGRRRLAGGGTVLSADESAGRGERPRWWKVQPVGFEREEDARVHRVVLADVVERHAAEGAHSFRPHVRTTSYRALSRLPRASGVTTVRSGVVKWPALDDVLPGYWPGLDTFS